MATTVKNAPTTEATEPTAVDNVERDDRFHRIVERVRENRLSIEKVRASAGEEYARAVEEAIGKIGESDDPLDALLSQSDPVVVAVRYGNGNEFYDFSESGIDMGRNNWIVRQFLDEIIDEGFEPESKLAQAIARARQAFESGSGVRFVDKKRKGRK